MRTLLLLRHAKSSWDDTGAPDHIRKLAPRGRRDAPRIAARLAEFGPKPELIVSSHAMRARETARLVAQGLGYPESGIRYERRIYLKGPQGVTAVVAEQADEIERLMIVGHNPDFTHLANALARDLDLDNLPTCGVVGIEFDCASWRDVAADDGRVVYLDFPKNKKKPIIH